MTYDVVALLDRAPAKEDLMSSLAAAGEDWGVRAVSGGDVVQLCDADGQVVLSIDTPLYLQVPGEPERLLGTRFEGLPVPVWWLEVRASARDGAYAVAWRYADDLIRRVGGQLWAPPPRRPPTLTGAPEPRPADAGGNDG